MSQGREERREDPQIYGASPAPVFDFIGSVKAARQPLGADST
jgi:hypothetical protein